MYLYPTVADFKTYFVRDFPFQPAVTPPATVDLTKYVQDSDITRAMTKANGWMNEALFGSQDDFTTGYMLMTAHCMVMSLRASSQGLSGKFDWATSSKGVGSVSVSQSIPQAILANPTYAWIAMSNYGVEFLVMVMPNMTGYMFTVLGGTQA